MKYFMIMKTALFFVLLASLGSLISCKKDSSGLPMITKVRATDANQAAIALENAVPGTFLVIEGQNLNNTTKVLFNGYEAFFNTAFNTSTHLFVQVPLKTPTPDRDPAVPNTITVMTPAGQTTYSFAINPPPPSITYIYNENTKPGSVMEIRGTFLLGVTEVEFPGGKKGTNIQKDPEGSWLKVTVPADLAGSGVITLNSPYGNTKSQFEVNNTKDNGVFANFEQGTPEFGWEQWGAIKTDDASAFPANNGSYIRSQFGGIALNDPGWWTNNRNVSVNNFEKIVVPASELSNPPDDYYLKFEINTKTPIKAGTVFLIESLVKSGGDKSLRYVPYLKETGQVLDTKNQWMTVTIPIKDFGLFNWDPSWTTVLSVTKVKTIGEFLEGNGAIGRFHIGIVTLDAGGIENYDAAIDNLRIAKVQK